MPISDFYALNNLTIVIGYGSIPSVALSSHVEILLVTTFLPKSFRA